MEKNYNITNQETNLQKRASSIFLNQSLNSKANGNPGKSGISDGIKIRNET